MRRREFVIALGSAATWPRAALSQNSSRVYRVGTLGGGSAMTDQDPNGAPRYVASLSSAMFKEATSSWSAVGRRGMSIACRASSTSWWQTRST